MLNICLPGTKPPEISAFPLSIPPASLPQNPSLDPQSPSRLEQVYFISRRRTLTQAVASASPCAQPRIRPELRRRSRIPPAPPGPSRAGTGSPEELGTDPPGMCRGAALPHSQPQSQLCPAAFQQPPTCLNPVAALGAQGGQRFGMWDIRCVRGDCSGHRGTAIPARAGQRGCAGMASRDLGSDAGALTRVFAREGIYPGNHPIKPQ